MSSIILPSRGQCIQITDGIQPCQCLWFFSPESLLFDQDICGHCGHGIHAHADYISMVVNHHPVNQCAAYAQKTRLTQGCTCEAQCYEHIAAYNSYRIPEPWTVLRYFNPDGHVPSSSATTSSYSDSVNDPFSPSTTSSDHTTAIYYADATNISFTPTYIPSPSPNASASYPYGDTVIFTPTPHPVVQSAIPQIEAHSRSEVENSYGIQYQDDNSSVNAQESRAGFHQDHPYSAVHSMDTWAGQLD